MSTQHFLKSFTKQQTIAVIIALIVFTGLGYWAGSASASGASGTGRSGASAYAGGFGGAGRGGAGGASAGANRSGFGGAVTGSIISMDANSLTISMRPNGTRIVYFASSTSILKTDPGTVADLSTGTNVVVAGTPAADGSVVAQSIQIRPAGMGFGGQATTTQAAPMMPATPTQ